MLSAAVMAVALKFAVGYADPYLRPQSSILVQVPALGCLIVGAMVVYFGLAFASGGADLGMIRRNLARDRQVRAGEGSA
jgi:putative peptidoglycan lipid II flippase